MLLRSAQVSYEEQVAHEERKMILDDALSWAEENALEFVFDFYTRHLLEKMWSMPECQKGVSLLAVIITMITCLVSSIDCAQ